MSANLNETQVLALISEISTYNTAFALQVMKCHNENQLFRLFQNFVEPVLKTEDQVSLGTSKNSMELANLFQTSKDNFWNAAKKLEMTEQMQIRINYKNFGS